MPATTLGHPGRWEGRVVHPANLPSSPRPVLVHLPNLRARDNVRTLMRSMPLVPLRKALLSPPNRRR